MTVEGHLVGAGRFRDRIDADAADPVPVKEVTRRHHDPVARTGAARAGLLGGASCRLGLG